MYKEALQQKLRFSTPKGQLSAEQIWDLSFKDLIKCIKDYNKLVSEDPNNDSLSFLEDDMKISPTNKLRFDILKDVYLTKRKAKDAINEAEKVKEHNEKIMSLIHKKGEEELEKKSVEDLQRMLR